MKNNKTSVYCCVAKSIQVLCAANDTMVSNPVDGSKNSPQFRYIRNCGSILALQDVFESLTVCSEHQNLLSYSMELSDTRTDSHLVACSPVPQKKYDV